MASNISFELTEDNSGLFKLTMYNVRFAQSMPMSLNIVIPELKYEDSDGDGIYELTSTADPIIPYIGGEEEKSEQEPLKLWGHIEGDQIVNAEKPTITAQCFRVPVSDGHTAAVFVSFDKKPTQEQMLEAWANFRGPAQELNLPSAPKQFLQ